MMTQDAYFPNADKPLTLTLCLEENSILLNKAVLDILEQPRQVQMLINKEVRVLLLLPCTVQARQAIVVPPLVTEPQFEISGQLLLKQIRQLMDWSDNQPRVILGTYMSSHHAVMFDLKTARLASLQMPLDSPGGTAH